MNEETQTNKMGDKQGSVYILSNPAFAGLGLLKIGFTTKEAKKRAKELYGTGVPDEFTIEYEGSFTNAYQVEQKVHKALKNYRYNPRREFFQCDLKTAINIIHEEAKKISVSVVNTFNPEYKENMLPLLPQTYTNPQQKNGRDTGQEKDQANKIEIFEVLLFMSTLPFALWYVLYNPVILDTFNHFLLWLLH